MVRRTFQHFLQRLFPKRQRGAGLPEPLPIVPAKIILPTAEEVERGTSKLERCLPFWRAGPAFYLEKPATGLVVTLQEVTRDSGGFGLEFAVDEVLVSDGARPVGPRLTATCGWNQPYAGFDEGSLYAPYCYTIYFEPDGVARAREICLDRRELLRDDPEFLLGMLRLCFRSNGMGKVEPLDLRQLKQWDADHQGGNSPDAGNAGQSA